jgi:hypothetical protein
VSARCAILIGAVALSALLACTTGQAADPWIETPAPPLAAREPVPATSTSRVPAGTPREPADIVELFTTRILPTCSLNDGVCHNANNYPDLRNLAALADLVDLPCGRDAALELRDACEPAGDHLVGSAFDVVVERVAFDAAASVATITTRDDVPSGALSGVEIRRGADVRVLASAGSGATFVATEARTVRVDLATATVTTRTFFEPKLPLREDRIWPADVNGNGIAGASSGWREIVPGRPDRSYLVARLWNAELDPELMPRQCRTWDDSATRAVACWIESLKTDEHGAVTGFFAPIDYAHCTFTLPSGGRCGPGL